MDITVGSRDGVDTFHRAEELVKQFNAECKNKGGGDYDANGQSDKGQNRLW